MVKEAGFRTYEAGSAEEAIRLLEEHADIGILFTDVNMSGSMNGSNWRAAFATAGRR